MHANYACPNSRAKHKRLLGVPLEELICSQKFKEEGSFWGLVDDGDLFIRVFRFCA